MNRLGLLTAAVCTFCPQWCTKSWILSFTESISPQKTGHRYFEIEYEARKNLNFHSSYIQGGKSDPYFEIRRAAGKIYKYEHSSGKYVLIDYVPPTSGFMGSSPDLMVEVRSEVWTKFAKEKATCNLHRYIFSISKTIFILSGVSDGFHLTGNRVWIDKVICQFDAFDKEIHKYCIP